MPPSLIKAKEVISFSSFRAYGHEFESQPPQMTPQQNIRGFDQKVALVVAFIDSLISFRIQILIQILWQPIGFSQNFCWT